MSLEPWALSLRVDIGQLQYLVALAREKHFTRAAKACHVTQPTLSGRIRQLEQELCVPIVERGQRFIGFTPDGERVLKWAQVILDNWSAMQQDPEREVLVYDRRGVPAGVVTFFDIDRAAGTAWWGYYLDNAGLSARGELMPAWIDIQRKAIRYAFEELSVRTLEGEVLAANDAVRRLNRRHGFTEVGTTTRDVDGTSTAVIRVRLHAPEVTVG